MECPCTNLKKSYCIIIIPRIRSCRDKASILETQEMYLSSSCYAMNFGFLNFFTSLLSLSVSMNICICINFVTSSANLIYQRSTSQISETWKQYLNLKKCEALSVRISSLNSHISEMSENIRPLIPLEPPISHQSPFLQFYLIKRVSFL